MDGSGEVGSSFPPPPSPPDRKELIFLTGVGWWGRGEKARGYKRILRENSFAAHSLDAFECYRFDSLLGFNCASRERERSSRELPSLLLISPLPPPPPPPPPCRSFITFFSLARAEIIDLFFSPFLSSFFFSFPRASFQNLSREIVTVPADSFDFPFPPPRPPRGDFTRRYNFLRAAGDENVLSPVTRPGNI